MKSREGESDQMGNIGDMGKQADLHGATSKAQLPTECTKARFDLVPAQALREVADVLTHGAIKHGALDYLDRGDPLGEFAAIQRHLNSWHSGTANDEETGLRHIAHAAARLLLLLDIEQQGTL